MVTSRSRFFLTLLTGCAALVPVASAQKKERDLITRQELVESAAKFPDLYQAIRSLRPHFLNVNRGTRALDIQPGGSPGTPMCTSRNERGCAYAQAGTSVPVPLVYVDGRKSGAPDFLKGISTRDVEEVRYLSGNQAGIEYGLGHEGGAILVKLSKEPVKP